MRLEYVAAFQECEKMSKIIIIGAGVAGIAAAKRLLENGFTNIIILEAENRIGGRIHSVEFGGSVVDLGAQWCHGQEQNAVYELVKDLNLLGDSHNDYYDNEYYDSTGRIISKSVTRPLMEIAFEIFRDCESMLGNNEPFGNYFKKV